VSAEGSGPKHLDAEPGNGAKMQPVTPESLKPFLHDLFEVNTFWTFDTKRS
jgi:hypothetical protein